MSDTPTLTVPWTRIRERAGLRQEDAAHALGVSHTLVSYWETGKRPMDARWLRVVGYWDRYCLGFGPTSGVRGSTPSSSLPVRNPPPFGSPKMRLVAR